MSKSSLFKSLTIKGRLIALGLVSTLGFASVVATGWYGGALSIAAIRDANLMKDNVSNVNEMRLANTELVLAAMDSIVDKDDGKILPERAENIENAIARIRESQPETMEMALVLGRPDLTENMEADLDALEQAITVELPHLIETRASEAEFAALDDAIDAGGEPLDKALDKLAELGNEMVEETLVAAENMAATARSWQVGITAAFLLLVGLITAVIVRHVSWSLSRFGSDMAAIADGRLDAEIEAEHRTDEVGQMAQSLVSFRDAAVEKAELQREAENNRSLSERERLERERVKEEETRQMKEAVDSLADGLNRLSGGDLSVRLTTPFMDSLDVLRVDFNKSVEKLNATLAKVRDNIDSINGDAREMRSGADDLSRRTEQQAASLEETSAALEQLTATVRSASDRASEANAMAGNTRQATDRSGKVVADAVAAMNRIEKASTEISNIINVIDEIAFQTNLLALNAGVEAARAGEAGMGFAVVAQEVRELAQRSANAASEIKTLIENSGGEVSNGVVLVRETGKALEEISGKVSEIGEHISSIATGAVEQSTGLQEINIAVGQMDKMTQQNAAMVEESTAVTHRLSNEAGALAAMVAQFKLSSGNAASGPAEADASSAPADSPARNMVNSVMRAFG